MKQYQTGVRQAVLKSIKEAKKLKMEYISKKDIIRNVTQQGVVLKHPESQVGQALYHLQKKTKFRRPQIRKFLSKDGKHVGWSLVDETFVWKEDRFE